MTGGVTLAVTDPHIYDQPRIGLRERLRSLAPTGAKVLIMLDAYIDDSGTHDDSDVVVMGGFVARTEDWIAYEFDWCSILEREPVEFFHMSDCEVGDKPFNWEWPRRAALIHDLRQVIIRYRLQGTSFSISRKDWDELVVGEHREFLGNAIDMAFGSAIGLLVRAVRTLYPTEKIALIVDDQKQRREDLERIIGNYKDLKTLYPELESIAFGSMRKIVPLQAADMLAWESYRYALEWLKTGAQPVARAHYRDFLAHGHIVGAFMGREEIKQQIAAGYAPLL